MPGIEEAEIVEILDHHHIGSIETRVPVRATFDPVGSTATLVVERFRAEGREPRAATAEMLLAAILSDTVILSSPTTTERDRRVVGYLEELLQLDAREFGMEMFEYSSDVSDLSGEEIVTRDAKEYDVGGRTVSIAQVETVGMTLARPGGRAARRAGGHPRATRATTSPRSWSPTSSAGARVCSSPAIPRPSPACSGWSRTAARSTCPAS